MRTGSFLRLLCTIAVLSALGAASSVRAQSFPGGGRGGTGGGARPPAGRGASSAGNSMAKRFEEMASLKRALRKVEGLSKAQKDSLKRIEATYKERFRGYSNAAKKLAEDAAAPGGRTDLDEMRKLRDGAETLQQRELAEARAVLSTDAQRETFDANVAAMKGEQAKRDEQARKSRE